jgi:hypothetical protein
MHDAARMRAHGRVHVQPFLGVAAGCDLVQSAAEDAALAGLQTYIFLAASTMAL